jgi:hypothetical protein
MEVVGVLALLSRVLEGEGAKNSTVDIQIMNKSYSLG